MAGMTIVTELAAAIQSIFREEMRPEILNEITIDQFGKIINLPLNAGGKQIKIFNPRKLGKITTNLTEATIPATPQDIFLDWQVLDVERYGGFTRVSEEAMRYPKGNMMNVAREILTIQAKESGDWRGMRKVAPYGFPLRADADATYEKSSTVKAASTPTTTVWLSTANIVASTGLFTGGYAIWTSGVNKGQVFEITASTSLAGSNQFTVGNTQHTYMDATMPQAPAVADAFTVVVGTGIVATDVLSAGKTASGSGNLVRFLGMLNKFSAKRIRDAGGDFFVMIADNEAVSDLLLDPDWRDAYKYTAPNNIIKGEIGAIAGVRVVMTTQPYRESVAGVQSDSGVVHRPIIFGRDAYYRTKVKGDSIGLQIEVMSATDKGQTLKMYGEVGWEITNGYKAVQGLWMCSPLLGCTIATP